MASVNYRIIDYMNAHQQDALQLHMPYLSQVTGQQFSPAEGAIIYRDLDPFISFDGQKPWFHDPKCTYYYRNLNGSIVNNFKSQGIYKKTPPTVDDVIVAAEVYDELSSLKKSAAEKLQKLRASSKAKDKDMTAGVEQAQRFFDAYDYLDANTLADQLAKKA
jgi:hypothetical protein